MTNTAAKTTALIENGSPVYAGEGSVRQEGSLKVYICNGCGDSVVWATSSRTGRKYRVQVSRGYNGQRFYMKRNAHKCEERQEALTLQRRFAVAQNDYMVALRSLQDRKSSLSDEEIMAELDVLDGLSDAVEAIKAEAAASSTPLY